MSDVVIFYETPRGNSEVWSFIQKLAVKAKKGDSKAEKLFRDIMYCMERFEGGMPHSRVLRNNLYELRPGSYRITYFRWKQKIVVLTIFQKKTGTTPDREIERAEARMKDWIRRFGK